MTGTDPGREVAVTKIGAVFLGWLVLVPIPAQAKGMELTGAVLRGPGLHGPLELDREEFGIVRNENSPAAIAVESLNSNNPNFRPQGRLGPRYELTYRLNIGFAPDLKRSTVRIVLYPYAGRGPVAFVPPGQTTPMPVGRRVNEVSSGWHEYPPALIENFRRHGLPSESSAPRAEGPAVAAWVFAGGLLLLLGFWLRMSGPISNRTPSTAG